MGEALGDAGAMTALIDTYGGGLASRVLYMPDIKNDAALPVFLRAVSPGVLVTGEFDPSQANEDAALRKEISHMTLLETSKDGAVTIKTEGSTLSAETYIGERTVNLR